MPGSRTKVLYIAGWGRSGSTLLQRILGQLDGFFAAGELYFLWQHGFGERRRCGCGRAFDDCEVWQGIVRAAFGGIEGVDARAVERDQAAIVRLRHLPWLMLPRTRPALQRLAAGYLRALERLYTAIPAATGCRVVVDSSKLAAYGYVLGLLPAIDLHVVHLVRDARAVAFSWQRERDLRDRDGPSRLVQHGPVRTAALWGSQNLAAELLWRGTDRYLRLRYEELVADPPGATRRVLGLLGEPPDASLPFLGSFRVRLSADHTVQGNPIRFDVGDVDIRPDDEWKEGLSLRRRAAVTGLAWPLLMRYGYLFPWRRAGGGEATERPPAPAPPGGGVPGARVAVVLTVLDEAQAIDALLQSIGEQTRRPDEVVVVDGGSRDGTWERLRAWAGRLPLTAVRVDGANIARGRNVAIGTARADILAVTDAGVRLDPRWLEALLARLTPDVDVVSGFYRSDPRSTFEVALGAATLPAVDAVWANTFLPSSRSLLLRRTAWEAVRGYPEWLDYCEDLQMAVDLRGRGYRFAFAREAIAWFRPRRTARAFFRQYYRYARGDGKAGLWGRRHALRYAAYGVALGLLATAPDRAWTWAALLLGGVTHTWKPYRRLGPYLRTLQRVRAAQAVMLVPILRVVGDVANMAGFAAGSVWRARRAWSGPAGRVGALPELAPPEHR